MVKTDFDKENGRIQTDWEIKSIKNIAPLQRGFDLPTNKLIFGKYPVVYSNGILNFHNSFKVKGSGVVTGRSGTIGKVIFIQENFWPHNTTLWVTDFKGNHPQFIFYLYTFLKLKRFATGSGVPTLNRNNVHAFEVLIPKNYNEQTLIVEKLNDIDQLIQKFESYIIKKKNIKQGVMHELLTGKRRLRGFNDDWEVKELDKIVEIKKGQLITEKTSVAGNIPVIGGGKTSSYYHNKPNRFHKTITISASGANAGYVSFHDYPIFASDCSTIEEVESYSIEFIYFQLKLLQNKIYHSQAGGAQPHIHAKELYPLNIPIPNTKKEQTMISEVLLDIGSEIRYLENQLDKYHKIKQGIMQKLLTGEIRLV